MTNEYERIILPIDGSDQAKKAAKKAFTIAKNRNIDVYAVHVIHRAHFLVDPEMLSTMEKMMRENADAFLDEIGNIGKKMNITIHKKIIHGNPFEEIINFAQIKDLIVMGNKGKTGLEKIFIGSVTEKVLHHAPCDVLVVKTE